MKHFELGRSRDRVSNNVTFTWSTINRREAAILAKMAKEESFENLVYPPYGFTLMKTGNASPDIVDYCVVISSEEDIPQVIVDKVSDYINKYIS